jgi:cyclopropane fatty-acyl-phospholipid synthase-like methyltransferase
MLEAIGKENFNNYFASIDRLMKPEGLAVIQVITTPDHRYDLKVMKIFVFFFVHERTLPTKTSRLLLGELETGIFSVKYSY